MKCFECTHWHRRLGGCWYEGYCLQTRAYVEQQDDACASFCKSGNPLVSEKAERPTYKRSTTFEEWAAWREAKGVES